MALHSFLGMDIGVPAPSELAAFYQQIGLVEARGPSGPDSSIWGAADMPGQIRIHEAPWRQLISLRVGCDDERDLHAAHGRLAALGAKPVVEGGVLRCPHPGHGWEVVVEPCAKPVLSGQPGRALNRPGARVRTGSRAEVVVEERPRPPRRLGHVVMGSPDPVAAARFFTEGVGFRVSDVVAGIATFMRCSSDHHNLLIQPAPVPYLNHYAFELDDIDAVGAASAAYLAARGDDHHVIGLGRHVVGSNVFSYMKDPCGTMFELFTDMDDIPDDDAWEVGTEWAPDAFAAWGPKQPPPEFFAPADLPEIAKAWEARSGGLD